MVSLAVRTRGPRHRSSGRYRLAVAAVVIGVIYVVVRHPARMPELTAVGIALGLAIPLSRYPAQVAAVLVTFVPLATFAYSFLYKLGMPGQALHQGQSWKEFLILTLLIAAWRSHRSRPRRFDRLDWAAIAYITCIVAYYLLPHLFTYGSPVLLRSTRYAAMRDDIEYVVAFMAARHAAIGRDGLRTIARWVLISGTVIAFGGVYEHLRPHSWSNFVVNTMGVAKYRLNVQHNPLTSKEILDYDTGKLRVGSVLLSPITLGPYLLVPLAIGIEILTRRASRRAASVVIFAATGLIGGAILYTGTRSSVIGLAIIPLLALRPGQGRTPSVRLRLVAVLAVLVVAAIPAVSHSTILGRTTAALSGSDGSANAHVSQFHKGVHAIAVHPLGGGLGSVGAIGQSLDAGQQVTAEDYYLQVGDEVGIHTLIAFLFLTVFLLFALNRSVSAEPDEELSGGAWLAGVALAIGAAMLHIWAGLEVSLVFWTVAGAVVGAADGQPLVPTRSRYREVEIRSAVGGAP